MRKYGTMPELPEVETTVRGLRKHVVGKTIVSAWTDPARPTKSLDGMTWQRRRKLIEGKKITAVTRRAKYIVINFENGNSLYIHQKMSGHLLAGRWRMNNGEWRSIDGGAMNDSRNQHIRALLILEDCPAPSYTADRQKRGQAWSGTPPKIGKIAFGVALSDTRRFATITYVGGQLDNSVFPCNCKTSVTNLQKYSRRSMNYASKISSDSHSKFCNFVTKESCLVVPDLRDHPHLRKLGPEPLDISLVDFQKLFNGKKGNLKPVLMDPHFIVGIGNIYADEILWRADLHPLSRVENLTKHDYTTLFLHTRAALAEAIKMGGSSVDDYRTTTGESGEFQNILNAYQQTGQLCGRKDGGTIQRIVIGQRSTHFCPKHQKLR